MTIDANHMSDQGPLFSFPMARMGSSLSGLVMLDPHSAPHPQRRKFFSERERKFQYFNLLFHVSVIVNICGYSSIQSAGFCQGEFPKSPISSHVIQLELLSMTKTKFKTSWAERSNSRDFL